MKLNSKTGVIPIEKTDWNAIRAEYIGGTMSQRKLAAKHGVSADVLMQKANKEHWKQDRDKAISMGLAKSQQKAADTIADNATVAARIRAKLLHKLEREIDALPDLIGSETRNTILENEYLKNDKGKAIGNKPVKAKEISKAYKLRDLTAAFKDLTADMQMAQSESNPLLQSLLDLERRSQS